MQSFLVFLCWVNCLERKITWVAVYARLKSYQQNSSLTSSVLSLRMSRSNREDDNANSLLLSRNIWTKSVRISTASTVANGGTVEGWLATFVRVWRILISNSKWGMTFFTRCTFVFIELIVCFCLFSFKVHVVMVRARGLFQSSQRKGRYVWASSQFFSWFDGLESSIQKCNGAKDPAFSAVAEVSEV